MLKTLSRIAFLALASYAVCAGAQTIQLPSVPVGGALVARVTLNVPAGIDIALTVPAHCGTFQGAASMHAVTDASGSFSFVFTPGTVPGNCVIQGQNGAVIQTATTNIYRPSDVVISPGLWRIEGAHSGSVLRVAAFAGGAPVRGGTVSIDPLPGASSPTFGAFGATTTDDRGEIGFLANFPGVTGIYDFTARLGTASRILRIDQRAASEPPLALGLAGVAADDLAGVHGPTRVSVTNNGCTITTAKRTANGSGAVPTGVTDFPMGFVSLSLQCNPRSSPQLLVEYATALPANGVLYRMTLNGAAPWAVVPGAVVSGNTVTFTLTDLAAGGFGPTTVELPGFGVARPGVASYQARPVVHDMWWVGPVENGWGMSLMQSAFETDVFAAIYAYDEAGKPTWWVVPGVTWDYGAGLFEGSVYSTYGTPWHAYDKDYTITNKAGSAKFTLSGTSNLSLDYEIDGVTGRRAMQRQIYGPPDSRTVPNVNGMWWGGLAQSGWGLSIVQQNATLFAVWYTYDETNKPTWFVMPGGAWTGASVYEGRIYKTRGSPWLGRAYDASQLQVTDVGPYRLTFNGSSATLAYTVEGRSGTLALVRQAPF